MTADDAGRFEQLLRSFGAGLREPIHVAYLNMNGSNGRKGE